jgi:(5-formylfuran-3-yl)methyl phosphate synthase
MTKLLISVTSVAEAQMALENGADIIDLKDPNNGALGALPIETICQIVAHVQGQKLISATVGDLPLCTAAHIEALINQLQLLASTGVDIIKIGFFCAEGNQLNHKAALKAINNYAKMCLITARVTPWNISAEADYSHALTVKLYFIAVAFK